MSTDEYVPRAATWDEIETGFHEYAADLTKQELEWGWGQTSFPPEFADWEVGMAAARKWLAAHDARVRRDAARDALIELRRTELALIPSDADEDDPIRTRQQALAWRIEMHLLSNHPEETP